MKKNYLLAALLSFVVTLFSATAYAEEAVPEKKDYGSADEAIEMVEKAVQYIKERGRDVTFAKISDPEDKEFHYKDLYVFVYDMEGKNLAHGTKPVLVGRTLLNLKDMKGNYLIKDLILKAKTDGKGWVDYYWPNPVTRKTMEKSSYIHRIGNILVGVGIYK